MGPKSISRGVTVRMGDTTTGPCWARAVYNDGAADFADAAEASRTQGAGWPGNKPITRSKRTIFEKKRQDAMTESLRKLILCI
jgi:hypothetical protein